MYIRGFFVARRFQSFRNFQQAFACASGRQYNPAANMSRNGHRMTSTLASLTECIAPQLIAVDRMFTRELESEVDCVNTLVRHVSRFRGKMLRPCLVLLSGRACGEIS